MDKKLALTIQFLALDKLSGSMKKIVGLGEKGTTALARMKRQARDLERQMGEVRGKLAINPFDLESLTAERKLRQAIAETNRELQKRAAFLKIDRQADTMRAHGEALQSRGQSNMIGGAGMLAPFILAGKQAMDFSSGMVDIQQKAGLTNAELFKMAANIQLAARRTHQLPEDMRAAVDVLAGFGMDARDAAKLAGPIGKLGTAFKVELADGAAAAYSNINNLKLGLNETGRAFDIMAAGGNAGAFEIKDMARWFPTVTAQARALGQTGTAAVADLTAALQIARRGTGDADAAANNVVNLLAKINAPGTIRAFQKNFGIDLPNALKRAYAEGKTPLEAIAEITKKALGGDLSRIGFAFEDRQAQDALRMLIQDMDDYKSMRAQISKADGTVNAAFSQREVNDASIAWKSFTSDISTTVMVLGADFLPVASQFIHIAGGMAAAVGDFAQAHPQATTALLTLVAAMGAAKLGLGALQFAFGGILKPAATAYSVIMKLRAAGSVAAAFPRLAKGFLMLRTAALFMAQGVMRAGAMMLANPVVLAITVAAVAIGAAAYLIWKHWDKISAAFSAGVAMLGQAWNWIRDKIVRFPFLFGPIGFAAKFVIEHWDGIRAGFAAGIAWLGSAWTWLKGHFSKLLPIFMPMVAIPLFVARNWGAIESAFDAGLTMLRGAWNRLTLPFTVGIAWLRTLPGKMLAIGGQIIAGLLAGLNPGALKDRLLSIAKTGVNAFKNFFGIKSPSRLFEAMGGHLTGGLALGIDKGAQGPLAAARRLSAGVAAAGGVRPFANDNPAVRAGTLGPGEFGAGIAALRGLPGMMAAGAADFGAGIDRGLLRRIAMLGKIVPAGIGAGAALATAPIAAAAPPPAIAPVPVRSAVTVAVDVAKDATRKPAPRPAAQAGPLAGGVHIGRIEIHQQPGENADQLARRVIDLIKREAEAQRRAEYRDHE